MDDSVKVTKDEFEDNLTTVLSSVGQNKEITLFEDLKARNGHRKIHSVIGNFGEELINDNGCRLIILHKKKDLLLK